MEHKLFFQNAQGLKLCGILSAPNAKNTEVTIIVHGYSSNKDRTSAKTIAEELERRGLNSFRFDLSGCGESEGKFEEQTISGSVNDLIGAIRFMGEQGYTGINLFGSSAGGLTVMATALKEKDIKRIALQAPVSDYPAQRLRKMGQGAMDEWKERGYIDHVNSKRETLRTTYAFIEDAKNHIMFDKVQDITCPVLIIHGDKDTDVFLDNSERVVKSFSNGKLIILPGADHGLEINGDRSISTQLFGDWFEKGEAHYP